MEDFIEDCVDAFIKMGNTVTKPPSSSHGKPKVCGAYLIKHNKSKKFYVGSHADLYARYYQHSSLLQQGKHFSRELQDAYDDEPEFSILYIVTETREEGYDIEQEILTKFHHTGKLFNTAKDARLALKGLLVSEQTRKKLSIVGKGRPHSNTHRENIRRALTGQTFSQERKDKISLASKGKVQDATRRALSKEAAMKRARSVNINGVNYVSLISAAQAVGITSNSLVKRIKSKNPLFTHYQFA